ncbi:MAG: hypothetical protein AAGB19_22050 [Cyanobacteria bacterium P01_F01_bin.3]
MSLVHLHKSVVTFHFKEILEDGHLGGPLALIGLSALILGPKLVAGLTNTSKRTVSLQDGTVHRSEMSLSEWVAKAQQKAALSQDNDSQPERYLPDDAAKVDKLVA